MNLDERVLIDGKILSTNVYTYIHAKTFKFKHSYRHTRVRSPHTDTKLINQSIENKQRWRKHTYICTYTSYTAAASVCDWRCHEKVVQAYIKHVHLFKQLSVRPVNLNKK